MKRDVKPRNQGVAVPVVVPFETTGQKTEPDGHVLLKQGKETAILPIECFELRGERASARFLALGQLADLAGGNRSSGRITDFARLKGSIRTLTEKTFGRKLTDAIAQTALTDPIAFAKHWLPTLWNEAIQSARVVMPRWWPRGNISPAIYCPDRETALFVTNSLGRELIEGSFHTCIGCGKQFKPHRSDQEYHDSNCSARHRNQRKRERDKRLRKQLTKKGKSHGEN